MVFENYWRVEQKCRKLSNMIHSFIPANMSMFVASIFSAIYYIFIGNLDTSTWLQPFSVSVPFETETIWKWFIFLFIQFNIGFSYSICISPTIAYFVCCCLYIGGICDQIDFMIASIANEVKMSQLEGNHSEFQQRNRKIKRELNQLIELHANMHE